MSSRKKKFIRRKNTLDRTTISRYIKLYHSDFNNKVTTRNLIEKLLGISISPSLFSNAFKLYEENISRTHIKVDYSSCNFCKELASCVRTEDSTFTCTSCGVIVTYPDFEFEEDSVLSYRITTSDPLLFEDDICVSSSTGDSEEEEDDNSRLLVGGGGHSPGRGEELLEEHFCPSVSGHASGGSPGDENQEKEAKTLEEIIPSSYEGEEFHQESIPTHCNTSFPSPPRNIIPFKSQDYLSQC